MQYPEETADFEISAAYNTALNQEKRKVTPHTSAIISGASTEIAHALEAAESILDITSSSLNTETLDDKISGPEDLSTDQNLTLEHTLSRQQTLPYTEERLAVEERDVIDRATSRPVVPFQTDDGDILVEWYATDDPANPQNWLLRKKAWVAFLICLYTFVVYCGSAIFTSNEPSLIAVFQINEIDASLDSLYMFLRMASDLSYSLHSAKSR